MVQSKNKGCQVDYCKCFGGKWCLMKCFSGKWLCLLILRKLGEPPATSNLGIRSCTPPVLGDCWYNYTSDDIAREDKRHHLRRALRQTTDWFKRALAVER